MMSSMSRPASAYSVAAPVAPRRRIEAVDIARGFALFGVLMVNMLDFSGPTTIAAPWAINTSWWNRTAELAVRLFGEGGFYTIFSFLFGLGFALQLQRATRSDRPFRGRFAIRLVVLATFGALHGFLLWDGDILLQYAVAGLFLLPFAGRRPTTMLRWSIGLVAFIVAAAVAITVAALAFGDPGATTAADVAGDVDLLSTGSFTDVAAERIGAWGDVLVVTLLSVPWFVGLFLAGAWTVSSGRLADWRRQRPLLGSVLRVSIPLAVMSKGLHGLIIVFGDASLAEVTAPVLSVIVGGPALGATYLCLVLLALQEDGPASRALGHLGPVGRMALTNYLTQTVVAVLLFYGWGLGGYGRFGPAATFCLTLTLFAAQVLFSRWWLSRFRFGPMEWLWRSMTYGRPQAMISRPERAVGVAAETKPGRQAAESASPYTLDSADVVGPAE